MKINTFFFKEKQQEGCHLPYVLSVYDNDCMQWVGTRCIASEKYLRINRIKGPSPPCGDILQNSL